MDIILYSMLFAVMYVILARLLLVIYHHKMSIQIFSWISFAGISANKTATWKFRNHIDSVLLEIE